jgi:hypothetical protein
MLPDARSIYKHTQVYKWINDGGVNSTMTYCKNFQKCQNASPVQ